MRRLTIVAAQEAVVGFETDDGLPLELAWPEHRVAILHAPDADVLDWLTEHQWAAALAEGDPDEAIAVLTTAGLVAVGSAQGMGGTEGVESIEETLKL